MIYIYIFSPSLYKFKDFLGGSDCKASVYNAGDLGSIPGLGRSLREGNGNPLQNYCLENPMDRGVHGVAKSRTRLSDFTSYKFKRRFLFKYCVAIMTPGPT